MVNRLAKHSEQATPRRLAPDPSGAGVMWEGGGGGASPRYSSGPLSEWSIPQTQRGRAGLKNSHRDRKGDH